jgi:hypothetical protein
MESFWGTTAGLIFSLVVYVLANSFLEWRNKIKYKRYLKNELDFNSKLLDSIANRLLSDRTTISSGQTGVFATYYLYIFHTGILNKTLEKGYFFDFLADSIDKNSVLEFLQFIIPKMSNIDFNISEYQKNPATKEIAFQVLLFQENELKRIKTNIDKVVNKL